VIALLSFFLTLFASPNGDRLFFIQMAFCSHPPDAQNEPRNGRGRGAVTKTLAKPQCGWVPSANAEALLTFSGLFCQKSRLILP
jgi:hypothetical protein